MILCAGLLVQLGSTVECLSLSSFDKHVTCSRPMSALYQARLETDLNMVSSTAETNVEKTANRRPPAISDADTAASDNAFFSAFTSKLQGRGKSSNFAKGVVIIGLITLLNASSNPMWHAALAGGSGPPPFLLNAAVSVVAFLGLLAGAPMLESNVDSMGDLVVKSENDQFKWADWFGGMELGFWKFLGTTAHLYGLSLTTADHGAFLIQLTTLIVPVIQGLQGEKIPRQVQAAVGLALLGVYAFTQDPNSTMQGAVAMQQQAIGDALCVAAAMFYSAYDIQTFKWGKLIPRTQLVTTKIGTQAFLSVALCAGVAWGDCSDYFASNPNLTGYLIPVVLWSGLMVNALATFLQVGGMQAIGPTRAQTIFASQPLWSSMLAYAFLGETIGMQGALGGTAFLIALYLAITAPKDETDAATTVEQAESA